MCDINSIYNLKVIGDGYDDIGPKAYILSFYTLDDENKIKYDGELRNNELILWKNEKDIPMLIKDILNKPKKLMKISENGHKRVKRDKHNEIQRTKEILKW